jgi:hypothetical protein
MSDLIRRMDAVQACQVGPSDEWSRDTKSGYNQAATDCAMNMLRVPAVQPDARIEALQADNARLRDALSKSRSAFARYVSAQPAPASSGGKSHE